MPIYDYLCSSCGQTTEVIHGIDAPGPHYCPACGAEGSLRKAFAAPTVHFKGSGWAKKDRSSASRARAKSGAAPSTSTEGVDGAAKGTGAGSGSGSSTGGGDAAATTKPSSSSED